MKSFFKFCNAAFCHQRSGITLVNNPWRPPATVFIPPRFPPRSHFISMIRAQEAPDVNVGLGRPGFLFPLASHKHAGTPAPLWSHSMITGRKGGFSLPVRLFVAPYLSSFGKHLVGNLWGSAPEDLCEIPARLRFWLLC